MRAPFVSARGTATAVALRLVRVRDDDDLVGFGEAVGIGELGAAFDLAHRDLDGRRAGEPIWRLLHGAAATATEVNATIATTDPEQAAREALAAREAGFRAVKLKVGIGDDHNRVRAVRAAAGDEMAIRLDANGAWSVAEAVSSLRALEPIEIECCEEPVSGLEAIGRVAEATSIPIALDETAAQPGALDRRVCTAVCLKIARSGGISGALEAARRARRAGYEIYLASMLDGPLGIAAALHVAAVVRPDRPCGLATLGLFEGREDPIPPVEGRMTPPPGPGLGDGLLSWYGVEL